MTNLLGPGFAAYARLLHPLEDHPASSTWASVARANGRTMHPSVEWEKIRAPAPLKVEKCARGRGYPGEPKWGHLDTWALEALCAVLARHTTTPQMCYFAVSSGALRHGPTVTAYSAPVGVLPEVRPPGPAPAEWQLDSSGPTFSFPCGNSYYLFEGRVGDAVRFGRWNNERWFDPQSPQFFWPADHAWCVATEAIDSTLIGGSGELVEELCASTVLEVLQIAPDAPFEDRVNL